MKDEKNHIDGLKKENIFKVPDQYFDDLPMRIQGRISENPEKEAPLMSRMQWAVVSTAAVLIISLGIVFFQPSVQTQNQDLLAQVSTEDIIDYLSEENVTSYEIASVIDVDMLLDTEDIYIDNLEEELSEEDLEAIYSEYDYSIDVL